MLAGAATWLVSLLLALTGLGRVIPRVAAAASGEQQNSDAACARCHAEIYARYEKTPMANASGPAAQGLIDADFVHAASGVHYKVGEQDGRVWLQYRRKSDTRPLNGRQQFLYFIGSGKRGRTYLFEQQGYWFEAPINWYAKKHIWDMAPAFLQSKEMPLTLPVDPGCLHCHVTGGGSSLPDARNHYAAKPFAEGGIRCSSCHGNGSAHVASGGKVKMLDLNALAPARRDSICLNCHLEGQVGITKQGMRPEAFRPGDDLFDYSVFFVHRGEKGSGGRASSQWEALLKSQCKLQSGDKLTCTTCHDPHGDPPPQEKVAYFRAKCLQCHAGLAEHHHPENPDCTECHMARPPANDIAHEQVTDHWIRKRVSEQAVPVTTTGPLVPVGREKATDRDWGLAYAQVAEQGDATAGRNALRLLQSAEKEAHGAPADADLHARLGFLLQMDGKRADAVEEYEQALRANPYNSLAASDLAVAEARDRNLGQAAALWAGVVEHNPMESAAGVDLAIVECGAGEPGKAIRALQRVLTFAPDEDRARTMLRELQTGKQTCSASSAAGH